MVARNNFVSSKIKQAICLVKSSAKKKKKQHFQVRKHLIKNPLRKRRKLGAKAWKVKNPRAARYIVLPHFPLTACSAGKKISKRGKKWLEATTTREVCIVIAGHSAFALPIVGSYTPAARAHWTLAAAPIITRLTRIAAHYYYARLLIFNANSALPPHPRASGVDPVPGTAR